MCKYKKCTKYDKLYIFETLPLQIQICKKMYKFSKTKVVLKENSPERHLSKNLCKIFF